MHIRGWATRVGSDQPVTVKITCASEVKYVVADEFREDVKNAGIHPSGFCGFSANFDRLNVDIATVDIVQSVASLPKSQLSLKDKKLFLLHLPKTAGSSVNTIFSDIYGEDHALTHIESQRNQLELLASKKFLSGHLNFNCYKIIFSASFCPFKSALYFSCDCKMNESMN